MNFGVIMAIAYGLLAIVGGLMGYRKAASKVSLISGLISGLLLLLSGLLYAQGNPLGRILAAIVATLLIIVFIIRLTKTRKFMPAGLMTAVGIVALIGIVFSG
ncbi:MAG: hypothetical protein MJA27_21540 [Pseudanabaenales cyanobacterium]|nr:hypothetical protein [Pseudanabaenales cyanobacterium]